MSRKFNHTIEVYGVKLDVTGDYDPAEPQTNTDPGWPSIIELDTVCVSGNGVNIHDILCDKTLGRIRQIIDRIED